jgi:hypothetical protein
VAAWLLEETGAASNPVDRFKRTPLEVTLWQCWFKQQHSLNTTVGNLLLAQLFGAVPAWYVSC